MWKNLNQPYMLLNIPMFPLAHFSNLYVKLCASGHIPGSISLAQAHGSQEAS